VKPVFQECQPTRQCLAPDEKKLDGKEEKRFVVAEVENWTEKTTAANVASQ